VIVKINFEKAYDLVKWEFLYYMIKILGFCSKWIQWIKSYLESASIFVLVSGSPREKFKPTKN